MLGAVECGVRTAYSVIDEYMKRGREAASQRDGNHTWSDTMSERPAYDMWSATWGPMWPFVAPWMQATRAWAAAMSAPFGGAPGMTPGEPPPGFPYGPGGPWGAPAWRGPGGTPQALQLSVQLSSESPAEVTVNIAQGVGAAALTADPLRLDDASRDAPPLLGVSIGMAAGQVRVSVTIPTDQPPGRYRGVIRDPSGMPVGDLAVRVTVPATTTPA
jgi:hypothetical protein